MRLVSAIEILLVIAAGAVPLQATLVTHTNPALFGAALPFPAQTVDFDSATAGTAIPSASSFGGITFTYSIPGPPAVTMEVVDNFDTTSGLNSLGTDDAGNFNQFIAGDEFDLSFAAPTFGIGMFFVVSDPLFDDDIELTVAEGTATNSATPNSTLSDGGLVHFIGLTSDISFTSAGVRFNPLAVDLFLFSVDDITYSSVPEPSYAVLIGILLIGVSLWRRQRPAAGKDPRRRTAT